MVDFERAIEVGLGFKVDLTPVQTRRGFDRLLVLGIRLSADQREGKAALETLLEHHRNGRTGLAELDALDVEQIVAESVLQAPIPAPAASRQAISRNSQGKIKLISRTSERHSYTFPYGKLPSIRIGASPWDHDDFAPA